MAKRLFCADYQQLTCCVGSHVQKRKTYADTVAALPLSLPAQIFTGSPRSMRRATIDEQDCLRAAELCRQRDIPLFIHACYIVNLSADDAGPAVEYLQHELRLGAKLGARGVVVHVGKSLKDTPPAAEARMLAAIREALTEATSCPLLLETPAGQGTELLTSLESFGGFAAQIDDPMFGLCVDTCHVFSTGCDPHFYLGVLHARFGRRVALVHFNDSKCPLDSRKDRHEIPGQGYIGADALGQVMQFCRQKGIPMVQE